MNLPELRPGMVGVNLKGNFDPLGTFDTVLQGDTQAAHVWWVLPNGKIATTGAKGLIFYGEVEPGQYLRRRPFFLLETVDPLTSGQLKIMQAAHDEMMRSGLGRIYGLWKFWVIGGLAAIHGSVEKTGLRPKQTKPIAPICSQAVAYPFWRAGVPVGKMYGKEDWTAVLPETILKEAQATRALLQEGWQKPNPCYHLRITNDTPYYL